MQLDLIVIRPRKKFVDAGVARRNIERAQMRAANKILQDLESFTTDWESPVRFTAERQGEVVVVGTRDMRFRFVDRGTRPHVITPRRATFLRYPGGFRPKTAPGRITSTYGGKSGPYVFHRKVYHPGAAPRRVTQAIAQKHKRTLYNEVVAAIDRML